MKASKVFRVNIYLPVVIYGTQERNMGSRDFGNIIFCFSKVMVGAGRFVALCLNPRRDIWEQSLTILVNLSKHGPLRPSLGNSGQCAEIWRIRIRILSRIRIHKPRLASAIQVSVQRFGGSGSESFPGSGSKI
jgi:hypothetical protein